MTSHKPLDRIGRLDKQAAATEEAAVLDLGRVDAAAEPAASRRSFFRGLMNSGVAVGAASALAGCGGGGDDDKSTSTKASQCSRTYREAKAHTEGVVSVDWSADGTRIASGGSDGVKIWDANTGKRLQTDDESKSFVSFSADGSRLATEGHKTIRVLQVANAALIRQIEVGSWVRSVALSADGTRVVCASEQTPTSASSDLPRIWDVASGTLLVAGPQPATVVALSGDGSSVVAAGDSLMFVFAASTGETSYTKPVSSDQRVTCLAFAPSGARVVSGHFNNRAYVWDPSGTLAISPLHGSFVTGVDFSPDGTRVASVSYPDALIWDASNGRELVRFRSYPSNFRCVAFSGDGTKVVTGDQDGGVKVWNAASGALLATFTDTELPLKTETTSNCGTSSGSTTVCTCDTVCNCNTVCTCDTVATCTCNSESGHYWYPN